MSESKPNGASKDPEPVVETPSQQPVNPKLTLVIPRDVALEMLRWFYNDAGYLSGEGDGAAINMFVRYLADLAQPTSEELQRRSREVTK